MVLLVLKTFHRKYFILIHSQGFQDGLYPVAITAGNMLDLGTIARGRPIYRTTVALYAHGKRF
jgi:hypothetical protein